MIKAYFNLPLQNMERWLKRRIICEKQSKIRVCIGYCRWRTHSEAKRKTYLRSIRWLTVPTGNKIKKICYFCGDSFPHPL
jgi:hypothetical protein